MNKVVIMIKKLKRRLRRAVKYVNLKIIISKRILLCKNVDSRKYLNCANCKYTQRCYKKYLKRIRWVI